MTPKNDESDRDSLAANRAQTTDAAATVYSSPAHSSTSALPGQDRKNGVDDLAREFFRAMLDKPGDAQKPDDWQVFGAWAEYARVMWDDFDLDHSIEGLHHLFARMAGQDAALGALLAGDSEPAKTRWTPAELYRTEFPDPKWIVPGIIPAGLSFLAGRPKVGKSWLALQLAHGVATGGKVFDEDIEPGKVLYLALEDNARRLKDRSTKQGVPAHARIDFVTEWPALNGEGLAQLITEVGKGTYTLIVIDTFSRAISGKADQMDGGAMTDIVGQLQRVAQGFDVAMLVIDHHRKTNAFIADPIDDIMGATGKAAVADAAIGLYKERGKAGAQLKITGRDIEERTLALEWDAMTWSWQMLGEAGEVMANTRKADVIDAIRTLVDIGELPTTNEIASITRLDKSNVSHILADLLNQGHVAKGKKAGRQVPYYIPGSHDIYIQQSQPSQLLQQSQPSQQSFGEVEE